MYGASAATAGELVVDGSFTGRAYGTSEGVVGFTSPVGVDRVLVERPLAFATPAMLAFAGVVPVATNETTAAVATATADSLPGDQGTFLDFLR